MAGSVTRAEVAARIDHTLLKPGATVRELDELCSQAVRFGFYGVCVNPSMIEAVGRRLAGEKPVPVCVVGFPLGATLPEVKSFETAKVVERGAREIDMVLNLGAFKGGEDELVLRDIAAVVDAADGFPVKVILETALLSDEEIVRGCRLSVDAGAAFVKTSTGFGPGGATAHAVSLMRKTVGPDVGVKASGGIHTFDDALAMIEAGADRIGASASVAIVSP
jgi:deoxyribose-phosphate aldolase